MAQAHGDRLTATDASFLAQEGPSAHMHVGAVMIFEGPPPLYTDFVNQIRARLHLVPRYRQKLAFPPIETGRPVWIDDPSFNLEYHVRHTALPHPGSEEQLRNLAARIHSQQLDRAKPLWEIWLVDQVEGGRFAMITKTHHCLVDGVSGVDIATVLFDVGPYGDVWLANAERLAIDLSGIDVLFLDTGYHFVETIGTRDAVEAVYDINVVNVTPENSVAKQDELFGKDLFAREPNECCRMRKVEPLGKALQSYSAWVTGIRRVEAPTRANAPLISWDKAFGLVKINPLAAWTDEDMQNYIDANDVLVNPLVFEGYPSIGCAPCTAKPAEGADPRSGRWAGTSKTECGLHAS